MSSLSSLIKDQTHALRIGSAQFLPLDSRGIPWKTFLKASWDGEKVHFSP